MMSRFKKHTRAGRIFSVLLIVCSIFFVFDMSGHSLLTPVGKAVTDVFAPLYASDNMSSGQADAGSDRLTQLNGRIEQLEIQLAALAPLAELMDLKQTYTDYQSTGAVVIGHHSDGWYDTYIIDKGSSDGISAGMNVLSGGGLAGIITETSEYTAKVRSVIDESSAVSCMLLKSQDLCTAEGDIRCQSSGRLHLTMLGQSAEAAVGDEIVTSYSSSLYLPNLPVGYITSVSKDSHGFIQSGEIIPAADFSHLTHVLIITDLKSELVKGAEESDTFTKSRT